MQENSVTNVKETDKALSRDITNDQWNSALNKSYRYILRNGEKKFPLSDLLKDLGDERFLRIDKEEVKKYLGDLQERIPFRIEGDASNLDACRLQLNAGTYIQKCRQALLRGDSVEKITQDFKNDGMPEQFLIDATIGIAAEIEKLGRLRECRDLLKTFLARKRGRKAKKETIEKRLKKEGFTEEEIKKSMELMEEKTDYSS